MQIECRISSLLEYYAEMQLFFCKVTKLSRITAYCMFILTFCPALPPLSSPFVANCLPSSARPFSVFRQTIFLLPPTHIVKRSKPYGRGLGRAFAPPWWRASPALVESLRHQGRYRMFCVKAVCRMAPAVL